MQRLSGRGHHIEDIVLRSIWRNVQTVEMKIGHLHAGMTETIFFRLGGELILVFHVQSTSRLDANDRWRVVALKAKFGFTGDWIRRRHERDRRACLWQFRDDSVLRTGRGDKQSDVCYPAKCVWQELLQHLHRKIYRLLSGTATARA